MSTRLRFAVRFVVWSTAGAVIALLVILAGAYVKSQPDPLAPVPFPRPVVGDEARIGEELFEWDGRGWVLVSDCPPPLSDIECGA